MKAQYDKNIDSDPLYRDYSNQTRDYIVMVQQWLKILQQYKDQLISYDDLSSRLIPQLNACAANQAKERKEKEALARPREEDELAAARSEMEPVILFEEDQEESVDNLQSSAMLRPGMNDSNCSDADSAKDAQVQHNAMTTRILSLQVEDPSFGQRLHFWRELGETDYVTARFKQSQVGPFGEKSPKEAHEKERRREQSGEKNSPMLVDEVQSPTVPVSKFLNTLASGAAKEGDLKQILKDIGQVKKPSRGSPRDELSSRRRRISSTNLIGKFNEVRIKRCKLLVVSLNADGWTREKNCDGESLYTGRNQFNFFRIAFRTRISFSICEFLFMNHFAVRSLASSRGSLSMVLATRQRFSLPSICSCNCTSHRGALTRIQPRWAHGAS